MVVISPLAIGIGGGLLSGAADIFGQSSRNNAAYKAAKQQHNFQWQQQQMAYSHRLQQLATDQRNTYAQIAFQQDTAADQYKQTLAIRQFDFENQIRMFNRSEEIYGMQVDYNAKAAKTAMAEQAQMYEEALTGLAFEQQDQIVQMLKEQGAIKNRGVSGNSQDRQLGSIAAQYGRNQAIMAKELTGLNRMMGNREDQIRRGLEGANMQAEASRMLKPRIGPAPVAPSALPIPQFTAPMAPMRGPAPQRQGINWLGAGMGAISSGLNFYNQFNSTKAPKVTG